MESERAFRTQVAAAPLFKMSKPKIRNKLTFVIASLLLLVLLVYDNVYWNNNAKTGFTISNYLKNPQEFGNYQDELFGKIVNMSQGHFYFNIGDKNIKIYGSGVKKSVLGETVLFVDFKKDGKIQLIDYHNYNYNYFIYIISFFALIIFVIIFFKEWKFTSRGFKDA